VARAVIAPPSEADDREYEALDGICIVLAAGIATAHEGSDPLAAWYRSLTTADGKSCCSRCMTARRRRG
jgi:hypothetical protein